MRDSCVRIAIVAIGASLSLVPAHAACLKASTDDQAAEGRLVSGRFTDAAGRREQAYILQLSVPACLEGDDETDKVERTNRIHVYATDDKLRRKIGSLVGKTVRVKGNPFGQHTAHHHAPIVMLIGAIEPR